MKRFMIVSKMRSGTNHLVSLLKSHPQIACYGEVFRDGYNVTKLLGKEFADYVPIDARTSNPNRFLDDLEVFVRNESEAFGFKIFPDQFLPVEQIAERTGLKVIRLVRTNLLATYSSDLAARLTGQGSVRVGQEVRKVKLDFNAQEFEQFIEFQSSMDDEVNKSLEIIPNDRVFEMSYTDMASTEIYDELQNFLGVEQQTLTSNTRKRNSSNIVDRFKKPRRVISYLKRRDLMDWAAE